MFEKLRLFISRIPPIALYRVMWMVVIVAIFLNLFDAIWISHLNRQGEASSLVIEESFHQRREFEEFASNLFFNIWAGRNTFEAERLALSKMTAAYSSDADFHAAAERLDQSIFRFGEQSIDDRVRSIRGDIHSLRNRLDQWLAVRIQEDRVLDAKSQSFVFWANFVDLCLFGVMIAIYGLERSMKRRIVESLRRTLGEVQGSHDRLQMLTENGSRRMRLVAHDLRAPLAAIRGFSEVLSETADKREPVTELIGRIERLTSSTLDKVKSLLDEETVTFHEAVQVGPILEEVCTGLTGTAEIKRQRIFTEPCAAACLIGNRADLTTCFFNLLDNAVKFSPVGGKISVICRLIDESVEIRFLDQGPGFSEKDLRMAFAEGRILSARPTAGERSSGYGLYSVKKTVDQHGGTISLQNAAGGGAEVVLRFPRAPSDSCRQSEEGSRRDPSSSRVFPERASANHHPRN